MVVSSPLRGIITAMVTPLLDKQELDTPALERLIEHLIVGGVHGLFILGTTGEAPSLPYPVRHELIERTCRLVDGRVPVLVGITDTVYEEALAVARKARDCGAFGVVAAPPFYFRVPQSDLLNYFSTLAAAVPLPLLLYNAPSNTHHSLDVATVAKAAESSNIIGLKDSGSDMSYFHRALETLGRFAAFTLLVGPEDLLAEAVLLGAHGGMAAGSNVRPRLFVELFEASCAQDVRRASMLHKEVMRFSADIYQLQNNPLRGLKCALSVMGICGDSTALPLRPYTSTERRRVQEYLDAVDLFTGHAVPRMPS